MKINDHRVSIIIPVYNGAAYISDAILSVKQQSYTNWECIIINDGSTDNTAEIIHTLTVNDSRFICKEQQNKGLSATRNAGLELAEGTFIQFLDADDVLLPFKLEKQLTHLETEGGKALVSYTDYATGSTADIYKPDPYYITGKFKSRNYLNELIERWEFDMSIPPHAFIFSAAIFKEEGVQFDTSLPNHEDFDCWIQVLKQNVGVIYLDEKLCIYRITEGSMSKKMRLMGEGFLQVIDKHLSLAGYTKKTRQILYAKRLKVLQHYRRFDRMNRYEKLLSIRVLSLYYIKRIFSV